MNILILIVIMILGIVLLFFPPILSVVGLGLMCFSCLVSLYGMFADKWGKSELWSLYPFYQETKIKRWEEREKKRLNESFLGRRRSTKWI